MLHHYTDAFRTAIGDTGLPELPTLPGQKKGQGAQQLARAPASVARGGDENFPTIQERAPFEKLDEVPKIRQFRHGDDVDREIWQDENDIPAAPHQQDPNDHLGWEGHAKARQAPAEIRAAIVQAAKEAGQNPAYALAVADRESSFNPTAHASKSIFGLFQMSGDLRQRYGSGNSTDPLTQARGFMAFTRDLRSQMADRMGREPTDAETYMGHHFGGGRAARMISSGDPNTSVSDIFTPNELAQNPHIRRAGTAGALSRSITGDMERRLQHHGSAPAAGGGGFAEYGTPVPASGTPPAQVGNESGHGVSPGLDPTLPIADQWATAGAQRPPQANPNPKNWDRAVSTMPKSENVDDRRDEPLGADADRFIDRKREDAKAGTNISAANIIASDFSQFGTPLGQQAGLDSIGSAAGRPDPNPAIAGRAPGQTAQRSEKTDLVEARKQPAEPQGFMTRSTAKAPRDHDFEGDAYDAGADVRPLPAPDPKYRDMPASSNIDDRRGEQTPMVDKMLKTATGLDRTHWGKVLEHPATPFRDLFPDEYGRGEPRVRPYPPPPLAREAGIDNIASSANTGRQAPPATDPMNFADFGDPINF